MLPQKLLSALVAADFSNQYYLLCREHPFRTAPACKCPHPEVPKALYGLGEITKHRGPGRVYTVRTAEQHGGMEFVFLIDGAGTSVEPCLSFVETGSRSFNTLAFHAHQAEGRSAPVPPYPRPTFHSPSELREIVRGSINMALDVGRSFYAS
jgi:hypothetical protein